MQVCVYIEDTNLVVVSGRQGGPLNLFMSLLHDSVVSPSILMSVPRFCREREREGGKEGGR